MIVYCLEGIVSKIEILARDVGRTREGDGFVFFNTQAKLEQTTEGVRISPSVTIRCLMLRFVQGRPGPFRDGGKYKFLSGLGLQRFPVLGVQEQYGRRAAKSAQLHCPLHHGRHGSGIWKV